ncbi:unnamed protein product [Candidula unifasciata]|uniref:Antistasin-like domain-containing protein n=1 Tax=Candidula unifasciata TaxID=100452 RepID=A0A8S3ZEW4_9EUPU|nr:unnamed protein product [Candidula unifasciata]
MNTKSPVLSLVAVVTFVVCVNAAGTGRTCTLCCPEGQVLNKSACTCQPKGPKVECPLVNCLATEPPCFVYKTNPTTGCQTCECLSFCSSGQPFCDLVCPEGELLNATICKCFPKPECPLVKCQGLTPPCLSYRRNDKGCQTCECIFRCPVRTCPEKCPNGVEYFDDQFGCKSCRCQQPKNCEPSTCTLYCAKGYEKDERGCDKCKCQPCGNLCKIYCEFGNLVDFDGCQICDCKPNTDCGPVCSNATCEYGRVLDRQGCPTCQCVKQCPCGPVCAIACTYQQLYDKYGCPTCTCLPEP